MDFDEVIAKRRSARDFTTEPISKDVLMDIVRQAQRTPSWANSQPWKVYIATGEQRGAWSIGTSGAQPLGMGNRPAT